MDPKLAEDLDALYGYMLRRMMDANLKNTSEPLIEVKEMLSDLRATWAQAIEINKKETRESAGVNAAVSGTMNYRPLAAAI